MSALDDILSQPATRVLRRALDQDRLPSAYLFEGPSGVGKQKAAVALATEAITAGSAEPEALARRIAGGTHPDVRIFGPRDEGGRNIQVEFLRKEVLPVTELDGKPVGDGQPGPVASHLYQALTDLQYGRAADPFAWTRTVAALGRAKSAG